VLTGVVVWWQLGLIVQERWAPMFALDKGTAIDQFQRLVEQRP
jgi:hypothetical protein